MPERVQLQRTKGWRMPFNTVKVDRRTPWGNPFNLKDGGHCWTAVALGFRADSAGRQAASVELFRRWLGMRPKTRPLREDGGVVVYDSGKRSSVDAVARGFAAHAAATFGPALAVPTPPSRAAIRKALRGKNLACWCKPGDPCHADVLLELANPRVCEAVEAAA